MRFIANWYNDRGNIAGERGEIDRAISLYRRAIAWDRTWGAPWYNLGLIYKDRHDWKTSLKCNQEAVRRTSNNQAAWWNLGIAATALSDWAEARRAWSAYGIELPEGTGEIVEDFGYTPIRIDPKGDGEVVWTDRIDPARAIIRSVPLPESGHRFGDLLLHDGEPKGYRLLGGKEVPVFDELEVLSRSSHGTYEATVAIESIKDITALEAVFGEKGFAAEDWSSIRYVCQQCSEGRPHDSHDHEKLQTTGQRRIGIAAASEEAAFQALLAWISQCPACRVERLATLLSPISVEHRNHSSCY
jgi:hypothetical protein